jgi:putative nucleotidyltransferase with HDIG domain
VAYCIRLGKQLGLADDDLITLEHGALLHDIGKIGVPDHILLKCGPLTEEEWQYMRRHVEYGAQILRGVDFLEGASHIVAQHHEQFDGSGYPHKLAGEMICQGARIFAVADAVDAITSDRPYRKARSFEVAADELIKCAGSHFDPQVVKAFTAVPIDQWREIRHLTIEPGLTTKGQAANHSVLTVKGDRVAGEWKK